MAWARNRPETVDVSEVAGRDLPPPTARSPLPLKVAKEHVFLTASRLAPGEFLQMQGVKEHSSTQRRDGEWWMMRTQLEEKKTNCCVHCGISDLSLANRRLRFHGAAVALVADAQQNESKRSQTERTGANVKTSYFLQHKCMTLFIRRICRNSWKEL